MLDIVLGLFLGFLLTEIASYFLHRYLFHGVLWFIHQSHHTTHDHSVEHNDVFSIFFAVLSIGLIVGGSLGWFSIFWMWFGGGIAIYGGLYFVIHDLMTHRRFIPLKARGYLTKLLSRAHLIHHQRHDKKGQEPYGLFLVHPEIMQRVKKRLQH